MVRYTAVRIRVLSFGESVFDRVLVRRVRRQIAELDAGFLEDFDAGDFATL